MQNRIVGFILLFVLHLNMYAQVVGLKKLQRLLYHPDFEWTMDTLATNVFLYYEKDSYAGNTITALQEGVRDRIDSTLAFMGIEKYDRPIHYFIVETRPQMKQLVGWETNGTTNHRENYIVVIHTERRKMAFLNHELFHLLAMNEWGRTERWINEGMAVYSDRYLNGNPLHALSKHIIDQQQYIPVEDMAKNLRRYKSNITYPLLGSFMQYIDATYGRETTRVIWAVGRKGLKKHLGKSLEVLEKEWLMMLHSVEYDERVNKWLINSF